MDAGVVLDPDLLCKHIFFSIIILIAINISQLHYFSNRQSGLFRNDIPPPRRLSSGIPENDRFYV